MTVENWGYHYMLDCKGCNENARYPNAHKIRDFLEELVERIDMVPYGPPTIHHFGSGNKSGYTAIQLIETSNICGHFCDDSGDVYLDVFSCKKFRMRDVNILVREYFEPVHMIPYFRYRQA